MTVFSEMHEDKRKPQITAAVIPIDDNKSEMLPLVPSKEDESYYQSIPDGTNYGFMAPPLPPGQPPQYDSISWQPTMNRTHRLSVQIRKASIAILESTNWWGVFLAFLSGAFFTLSSAAVKALRSIDPMELLIIRSSIQMLVMLPIALRRGENLLGPKGQRTLLQLQGIVGGATLVLLFFSFRRLPLGDATTIIFSSPVFVMIMSFIFLREPCGFFRTLIVFLLLTGVVLISKPPFLFQNSEAVLQTEDLDITNLSLATTEMFGNVTRLRRHLLGEELEDVKNVVKAHGHHHNHQAFTQHYDVFGYLCAFGATLFTALNIVVMRKCKDVHYSVVVFQLSLWGLIVSGTVFAFLGHHHHDKFAPHGILEWVLAVLVSILGLSGQVLVAKALGLEGAGRVAVTRSLDIILAFTLQVVAFGEVPDYLSIMGAIFVLVCVLAMGIEEQIIGTIIDFVVELTLLEAI